MRAALRLRRPGDRRIAGVCFAEGPHLVAEALAAGLTPVAAFFTPAAADSPPARRLAALCPPDGAHSPTPRGPFMVTEAAFAALADTRSPQGVLGLFVLAAPAPRAAVPWALALDGVQDPGNVGALARALLAFTGPGALLLTGPGSADPLADKAMRASAGAAFHLRHRHAARSLATEIAALARRGTRWWALAPRGGRDPADADLRPPLGLVVGSEGRGVSAEVAARCATLTVAMPGPVESLNAALAGGIALYEAARQARDPREAVGASVDRPYTGEPRGAALGPSPDPRQGV